MVVVGAVSVFLVEGASSAGGVVSSTTTISAELDENVA